MKNMLKPLGSLLLRAYRNIVLVLIKFLFGELSWRPPVWLRFIFKFLFWPFRKTGSHFSKLWAAKRSAFWIQGLTSIVLVGALVYAGIWYRNLPKPHLLSFKFVEPHATKLEKDAKPEPLIINFSGSSAPLESVGKEVKKGITVTPALNGTWRWGSDAQLQFLPLGDWAVGQHYAVKFEPEVFASHVKLEEYKLEFDSPHFVPEFTEAYFYEDPLDSKLKEVVATLQFSHPVDKAELERRLSLKFRVEPIKDFESPEVKSFGFKVTYDEQASKAYIHSEVVGIPEHDGEMLISLDKGVKSARAGAGSERKVERTVHVPGIENYFRINSISASQVTNSQHEIDRVVTIESSASMKQEDLAKSISVLLLPKDKPAVGNQKLKKNYRWYDAKEVVPEVVSAASALAIEWIPNEREYSNLQSFKFKADVGRNIFVKINKGLKSFGDYPLSKDSSQILYADDFPKTVKILHDGAILSLSGDKKLSIMARNLEAVQFEVARLLPGSINHLVTQSYGSFKNPEFSNYEFGFENLAEVIKQEKSLVIDSPGKAQYTNIDFSSFLSGGEPPRGLFSLKVQGWDPKKKRALGDIFDQRLILVSDLGALVKEATYGTRDVFVSSIRSGEPMADVNVSVIGKNGLPVVSKKSDATGHVLFPDLKDFKREKQPVAFLFEKEKDLSFLPFNRDDRKLNLSRFDTGGLYSSENYQGLQAYLFSDRGIYRPGETAHIGMILKKVNWETFPDGLPMQISVEDPRGLEVKSENIKFSKLGFEEFSFPTLESSITGVYQFSLYILKDKNRQALLGSTSVRVEEFFPDRMTIKSELSAPPASGWYIPDGLKAKVNLRNLFGTAAADRKIKANLKLAPSAPYFSKYADYTFLDRNAGKEIKSYDEDLGEVQTDKDGNAEFDLKLERFERATFRMRFAAEGFEPEGGRSVSTDIVALVSPAQFQVGYKADGALNYIHKDAERNLSLIAIGPNLEKVDAEELESELLEVRYVSVLTKQENGTYAYQSVKKEISKKKEALKIPAAGAALKLDASTPGSYLLVVRDKAANELSKIEYKIVGESNQERNLERNAELEVKLNKNEYAPGDEIELEVQAPYTGAGLITIEKDKVYAYSWFKSSSLASVQHIKIPENLEGNGYLTVTFVRGMDSDEIYMSPLSYGSVPFNVSRARHTEPVTINAPGMLKPGETLHLQYQVRDPGKFVIFGADEGILQFAHYKTPDPLSHFFRKRALEVTTLQILDLILPDFAKVQSLSASGGDEDALLGRKLNPFKRKGEKPVVFWSGILDASASGTFDYSIPNYFNGTIRVMALSVNENQVGVTDAKVISQGDFVIQPQAPYYVSPGDEFVATSLVANNLKGSGKDAEITVEASGGEAFEPLGDGKQVINIPEGEDRTARFKFKAKAKLGASEISFKASGAKGSASYSTSVGVRPAAVFRTSVQSGYIKKGLISKAEKELDLKRQLFDSDRKVEASVSTLPGMLSAGMIQYLKRYPYGCTEQLISQAMPALILGVRPEFNLDQEFVKSSFDRSIATLQARQNAEGAFGLWYADSGTSDFISNYATLYLLEAKERNLQVPQDLLERALGNLQSIASREVRTLPEFRAQAFAIYLLTRNGDLTTNNLSTMREFIEAELKDSWKGDLSALFMASTYALLKMDKEAAELLASYKPLPVVGFDYLNYYDATVQQAFYLYLLSRHFPDRARKLSGDELLSLSDLIVQQGFNTLDASSAVLGFDAYSKIIETPAQAALGISEILADDKASALVLPSSLFPKVSISNLAKKVRFSGENSTNLFYQLLEEGYDKAAPAEPQKNNIEIFREFRNEKGDVIHEAPLDSKVLVNLILRSTSEEHYYDIAVSDLIPGGFEIDLSCKGLECRKSLGTGSDLWEPYFVDVRDDRVLLFGNIGKEAQRFVYKIKPTNPGSFQIPPATAEGMYNRSVFAQGIGGTFQIGE